MVGRCEDRGNASFKHYGRLGVKVCETWHDFKQFYLDMGERPEGMSLDRIDPTRDYEPGNCRWASAQTQARNKRKRVPFNLFLSQQGGTSEWTWMPGC